jgi:hypothetical protein
MGRILTAACLALLCLGCDSGTKRVSPRPVPPPPCDLAVLWHGVRYLGTTPAEPPIQGRKLGFGGVPSCPDVLGGETGASRAVEVRTLIGVDPRTAVTVAGDNLHVYLAGRRSPPSAGP